MSFQVTSTQTENSGSSGSPGALALRWVYPNPRRAPLWVHGAHIVGRDESADVILDSSQVSRRHAEVKQWGPVTLLTDLESKNGVQVNGVAIKTHALTAGDVVRFGDVVAVVVEAPRNAELDFRSLAPGVFGGYRHRQAFALLERFAKSDLPIVLEGATGTGKERFAQQAHALSGRPGDLVVVNCATYSTNLAAAELFGYRRGAFTGAEQSSLGHVRAAEGGTLFLDELPELPAEVQPMLLRAIENQEVLPLGDSKTKKIDVRFVAATQTPLGKAVERGTFRADLRARLEVGLVRLPRLDECREIVPELFAKLYQGYGSEPPVLSAGFVEALCLLELSLNVRELDTLARRLAITPSGERLAAELLRNLPQRRPSSPPSPPDAGASEPMPRPSVSVPGRPESPYSEEDVVRLKEALTRAGGNVSRAAAELGISRARAYRMLERGSR
ncbi:MAG TPA: sigma 54-interacting transcriptional regulator [Polyangiaceae bacterium]|nr:sigma 54-interacting transcriptional regulator [Polyangiaceae bacterium]